MGKRKNELWEETERIVGRDEANFGKETERILGKRQSELWRRDSVDCGGRNRVSSDGEADSIVAKRQANSSQKLGTVPAVTGLSGPGF